MPTIQKDNNKKEKENPPIKLKSEKNIPWPLPQCRVKEEKNESKFVFNVYVGLISQELINKKVQKMLNENESYNDSPNNNSLTCFADFSVDDQGILMQNSYIVPDFVKSIYTLEKYKSEKTWDVNYAISKTQFESIGNNLNDILSLFNCIDINNIQVTSVVYRGKIKAPINFKEIKINKRKWKEEKKYKF